MSKVREGYKLTGIGEIPIEWEAKTIGDLFTFQGGSQPPRSTFIFEERKGYVRLIQIRDYKTDKYRTYIPRDKAKKLCTKEDIMIGRYGPPIFQILRGIDGAYNVALIKAIPSPLLDKEYGYNYLKSEPLFNLIDKLSQRTSGQTGIDMEALKAYPLPLPPFKEQQRIAKILSSVDTQVEQTEQLIEKTKELKKGLMQQLLTKGIGHTEFKQTELGEIPSEWEVLTLQGVAEVIMGQSPSSESYNEVGEGLPFYQGKSEFGKKYPTPVKWCTKPTKIAQKGDVLISVRAPVGELNICEETSCIGRGLGAIRSNYGESIFLYYVMQNRKEALNKMGQGSTFTAINGSELKNVLIINPTLKEQQKIAEILSTVDAQIEGYENEKEKYEILKKGLMQQLLTGKVRVKVD